MMVMMIMTTVFDKDNTDDDDDDVSGPFSNSRECADGSCDGDDDELVNFDNDDDDKRSWYAKQVS